MGSMEVSNVGMATSEESLDTSVSNAEPGDDLPFMKCIGGCKIDGDKEVVNLVCFHSICSEECLTTLKENSQAQFKDGKLACPICGVFITPESLKQRMIPNSVLAKKPAPKVVELICDICIFDRPAVAYCKDCFSSLCGECKVTHPNQRASHNHIISDDIEEKREQISETLRQQNMMCETHGDQLKTHFCFCCDKELCVKCFETHPMDHGTCNVEDEWNTLQTLVADSKTLYANCDRYSCDLNKRKLEIHSELVEVMKSINLMIGEVVSKMLARQKTLMLQGNSLFYKKTADFKLKTKKLELIKTYCGTIRKLEVVIADCDRIKAIKFMKEREKDLKLVSEMKMTAQDFDAFLEKDWHFQFNSEAGLNLPPFCILEHGKIEYINAPNPKPASTNVGNASQDNSTASSSSLNANPLQTVSQHVTVETMDTVDDTMGNSSSTSSKDRDSAASQRSILAPKDNGIDQRNFPLNDDRVRVAGTSLGSSISSPSESSSTSELRTGKRQRKKREFPGFLDTEESVESFEEQNSTNRSSTPSRKMIRTMQNVGEMETNDGYLSNDWDSGDESFSRRRRRSLRNNPTIQPSSDVVLAKKGRGRPRKNVNPNLDAAP